ncbi:hypothetical protein [Limnohabitans sp.]|uniref:hypothetical protein n=1 Tax=Limnohabitans sp. TaxID=1907725 RepID=UPI0033410923
MALLDEQLVEEWLNRQNFFTMRGIKSGNDEIDLLAIRPTPEGIDYWHVEVQISYRPIGYIGGDKSARRRDQNELRLGVEQWVAKKFTSPKKVKRRNEILPNANWKKFLVHGVLKDDAELTILSQCGVELIPYKKVLEDLCSDKMGKSSSAASGIIEMVNFLKSSEDMKNRSRTGAIT